jgi:transcription elongation factor Elf1
MSKVHEIRSAKLVVARGTCSLCGATAVGTLDFSTEEQTFFCAECGRSEFETAAAEAGPLSVLPVDPPYSC